MSISAPLRVPVELRLGGGGARFFRLAHAISEKGLLFGRALPDEIAGDRDRPLTVTFHLPEDPAPLELIARAVEIEARAPGAAPAALRFVFPDEESRLRIARYVAARVPE